MKKRISPGLILNITALVAIVACATVFTIKYWDTFRVLGTEDGLSDFVEDLRGTGIFGALILILVQALQVAVAIIPGEFVELAAGAMFGPWLGLVICLVGLCLGTAVIFALVRYFGGAFVRGSIGEREFERLKFLNDPRRALIILFFVFIIPGVPKDVLIYLVPLTKVRLPHFLIMSSIARIPTVISSTFVGSAVVEENYLSAAIVFSVSLLIAIPGLIFNKQICAFIEKRFPRAEGKAAQSGGEIDVTPRDKKAEDAFADEDKKSKN